MTRVLCVDDVPDNLTLLQADLEDEGYEVETAADGFEALEKLKNSDYDAVILDWMMPKLSGIETLKKIRDVYTQTELPVIMATALSEAANIVEALETGANDYVTKPIEIEILIARLKVHLQVRELTTELRQAANIDFLTKLPNRRYFLDLISPLHAAMLRGQQNLAVAMIDIDHFKQVNDQYGHDMGDEVLRQVAKVMQDQLRKTEVIGRLGGEEFAVALTYTEKEAISITLERIRTTVSKHAIQLGNQVLNVTVSIGFTSLQNQSIDDMLKSADLALYRAKNMGRNRTETDDE